MNEKIENNDITWYFIMKIVIVIFTCGAYIIYINSGVVYQQFSITTFLYFIPFILDFAIKEAKTVTIKKQKYLGILVPLIIFVLFVVGQIIISYYNFIQTININPIITILFSFLACIFIYFAFLDYQYYTKNEENVLEGRMTLRKLIDEKYRDSYEDMYEDIEKNKKEGIKEVVTKAENNRRRGKPWLFLVIYF